MKKSIGNRFSKYQFEGKSGRLDPKRNKNLGINGGFYAYKLKHGRLLDTFIEEATQKRPREHRMCIKQKQNISSQCFLRNPLTLWSFLICMVVAHSNIPTLLYSPWEKN